MPLRRDMQAAQVLACSSTLSEATVAQQTQWDCMLVRRETRPVHAMARPARDGGLTKRYMLAVQAVHAMARPPQHGAAGLAWALSCSGCSGNCSFCHVRLSDAPVNEVQVAGPVCSVK